MKIKLDVDVVRIPVVEDFLGLWKSNAVVFYQGIIKKFEDFFVQEKVRIDKYNILRLSMSPEDKKKFDVEFRKEQLIYWSFKEKYFYVYNLLFPVGQRLEKLSKFLDKEVDRKRFNLVFRVQEKIGVILDASDLKIGMNNEINGVIKGEKGIVELRTIYAGGYNIQCLHYRMIIKEVQN